MPSGGRRPERATETEGGAAEDDSRQLEGEALAPTGGRDEEKAAPSNDRLDGLALAGAELGVP